MMIIMIIIIAIMIMMIKTILLIAVIVIIVAEVIIIIIIIINSPFQPGISTGSTTVFYQHLSGIYIAFVHLGSFWGILKFSFLFHNILTSKSRFHDLQYQTL